MTRPDPHPNRLMRQADVDALPAISSEEAWIEVIHKMDSVYADLVRYQVELEEKNAALEQAQEFIDSVVTAMTDVLLVCDLEGRITQVNRALEQLVGASEEQLRGRPVSELFVAESAPLTERFHRHLGADALIDCEVALRDQAGRPAPLAMNCSSQYDHHGRLVGMVLIGRTLGELRRAYADLNRAHQELKETQHQLVHAEKMASLGRLVAGVAHELNNPISFVFGNVHALKRYGKRLERYLRAIDQTPDPKQLAQLREELRIDHILADMDPLIEGTLEGAERVSQIVQDLRRYSARRREPAVTFDLAEIIRTATQWVINACRHEQQIAYQLPAHLSVTGNRGGVHQILVNLVQNAVDLSQDQPQAQIHIRCGQDAHSAWVAVSDQGPGIAPADLPRLFDPFFTTKDVGQGTGLGLYVSYGLAEDMGGSLSAANRPQGGAEFTLRIPLQPPPQPPEAT